MCVYYNYSRCTGKRMARRSSSELIRREEPYRRDIQESLVSKHARKPNLVRRKLFACRCRRYKSATRRGRYVEPLALVLLMLMAMLMLQMVLLLLRQLLVMKKEQVDVWNDTDTHHSSTACGQTPYKGTPQQAIAEGSMHRSPGTLAAPTKGMYYCTQSRRRS